MSTENTVKPTEQEMSLIGHLLELRDRLVRAVIAIIVVFLVLFPFANDIYSFIAEPLTRYLPEGSSMMAIGVISPFLTPLKLALIASIFLSMPFLLYQVWGFIAPALYHNEKRLAAPMLIASTFLFYAGGAFVFFVVFPLVFKFMAGTTPDGVQIGTDIQLYLDFVIGMFFAFGLAFQVPVVTVLLLVTRMVSPEKMRHARPYVIVGAFSIAAFITPPDVISQTLLAVPMWFMYEGGLWFGERMVKNRDAEKAAQEANDNTPPTPPEGSTPASTTSAENPITTSAVAGAGVIAATTASAREAATANAQSSTEVAHSTATASSDAVLENALNSDEDFERAFAAIDMERAKLHAPLEPTQVADAPSAETDKTSTTSNAST
ncbi:MAG: twin arginine-targeting protein translocase TatC [Thiotrichales bacterium 32-46-8]|nr:MAG: twin arginine-targeting protein translocase TatC [Thiotrichales bacterium 32-46-8]OYY25513.1 MAG: twin arginine-targeting protein translocase TatC [Thiotrichales bacterium 35-46-9]OYZ08534.1 MAG: twin arginine-targeting protein translocase TatC [Thiotrichales bacterium 16-46-22]OZA97450.1 MAG: twin arginine-targeting protein translocase TatC [Thiotrichales bacterium 34-46-19]UCG18539.1 MAG: twin-arginine translocase subunit TatC [Thiotrichales bacterium]